VTLIALNDRRLMRSFYLETNPIEVIMETVTQ